MAFLDTPWLGDVWAYILCIVGYVLFARLEKRKGERREEVN